MKKETFKTSQTKAEIIKAFAETVDKNTSSVDEVYNVISSLYDSFSFLEGQRHKFQDDLSFYVRCIQKDLKDRPEHIVSLFEDMTDSLFEMLLLAGRSSQGLCTINSKEMKDGLVKIIDEYNE